MGTKKPKKTKKKKTAAEWNELFGKIGDAIAEAGYELGGDGMLHQVGEMFEDSPEAALEPEMIAPTIGYPEKLISAWANWEAKRRGL
jgi:hypothetical protein